MLTMNVFDDKIPTKPNEVSFAIGKEGLNVRPSNLTNSLMSPKLWFVEVVTSSSPVKLLYEAVLIPYDEPVVATPTIPTIVLPPAPTVAFTLAPTKGATPKPPVEPNDTITPPLGNWFWLTSLSFIINEPLLEVIPVNTIFVAVVPIPAKS